MDANGRAMAHRADQWLTLVEMVDMDGAEAPAVMGCSFCGRFVTREIAGEVLPHIVHAPEAEWYAGLDPDDFVPGLLGWQERAS